VIAKNLTKYSEYAIIGLAMRWFFERIVRQEITENSLDIRALREELLYPSY